MRALNAAVVTLGASERNRFASRVWCFRCSITPRLEELEDGNRSGDEGSQHENVTGPFPGITFNRRASRTHAPILFSCAGGASCRQQVKK
jgi:hypothetical protein